MFGARVCAVLVYGTYMSTIILLKARTQEECHTRKFRILKWQGAQQWRVVQNCTYVNGSIECTYNDKVLLLANIKLLPIVL